MKFFKKAAVWFGLAKADPINKKPAPKKHSSKQRKQHQHNVTKLEHTVMGWERAIKLIAFPFFLLSAWLTTKGLFDAKIEAHAANTEGMITAAMTAIVAAIMIGGANMLLFGLATHASRNQRWQVIGLVCCILPFVAAISTYNAILATSAEKSGILALRERVVTLTDYMDASMQDAVNAKAAKDSLLPLQSSLCSLTQGEASGGILTGGAKGKGATFASYFASCRSVSDIITTLEQTVAATETRREQAAAILAKMEEIPRDTSITVFERMHLVKQQDRLLGKLIRNSRSERVADRLAAQLNILENSVASLGVKQGAFGRTQEQAIANLRTTLSSVSGTIETLLASRSETSIKQPEPMPSIEQSIARHWKSSIPTIAIAIATDGFSLWLIAFIFTARSMVREQRDDLEAEAALETDQDTSTQPHSTQE